MSSTDFPERDVLTGLLYPHTHLGEVLSNTSEAVGVLLEVGKRARSRIAETFNLDLPVTLDVAAALDSLTNEMWCQGWVPHKRNMDLFITDFGTVLSVTLMTQLDGTPVFRSNIDLSNMSIWWPDRQLEAFCFYRMYLRLTAPDATSVEDFISRITCGLARR